VTIAADGALPHVRRQEGGTLIVLGAGAIDGMRAILADLGVTRAYVVTGASLAAGAVGERVRRALGRALVGMYARSRPHVPEQTVEEVAGEARSLQADALVGVGGGSPIGTAKAAAFHLQEIHGSGAGPAIIVLAVTQTLASIDWIMSLTPHWYSTIFGVYFFAGSFLGFIALLSVVAAAMRRAGLLDTVISAEHLHDIGKLLFAFTAFWAYIAFSQFFLIWYANLPEETIWYKARLEGSWMTVSVLLMAGHFAAPFFYLMGRTVKRRGSTLAVGGAWLLAMHFVDLYWQVMPTLHPEGVRPSALDVAALVATGGCFVAAASWLMRRQALVPLRDPRLAESLAFENA